LNVMAVFIRVGINLMLRIRGFIVLFKIHSGAFVRNPGPPSILVDDNGIHRAQIQLKKETTRAQVRFSDSTWFASKEEVEERLRMENEKTEQEILWDEKQVSEERGNEAAEAAESLQRSIGSGRSESWSEATPFGVFCKTETSLLQRAGYTKTSEQIYCHGFFATEEEAKKAKNILKNDEAQLVNTWEMEKIENGNSKLLDAELVNGLKDKNWQVGLAYLRRENFRAHIQ
jgi:hypothetical protein